MSASTDVPHPVDLNGKSPARTPERRLKNVGNEMLVKVQPARVEDLQPKYAQQLRHEGDDTASHGWYSSFSELHLPCVWSHTDHCLASSRIG